MSGMIETVKAIVGMTGRGKPIQEEVKTVTPAKPKYAARIVYGGLGSMPMGKDNGLIKGRMVSGNSLIYFMGPGQGKMKAEKINLSQHSIKIITKMLVSASRGDEEKDTAYLYIYDVKKDNEFVKSLNEIMSDDKIANRTDFYLDKLYVSNITDERLGKSNFLYYDVNTYTKYLEMMTQIENMKNTGKSDDEIDKAYDHVANDFFINVVDPNIKGVVREPNNPLSEIEPMDVDEKAEEEEEEEESDDENQVVKDLMAEKQLANAQMIEMQLIIAQQQHMIEEQNKQLADATHVVQTYEEKLRYETMEKEKALSEAILNLNMKDEEIEKIKSMAQVLINNYEQEKILMHKQIQEREMLYESFNEETKQQFTTLNNKAREEIEKRNKYIEEAQNKLKHSENLLNLNKKLESLEHEFFIYELKVATLQQQYDKEKKKELLDEIKHWKDTNTKIYEEIMHINNDLLGSPERFQRFQDAYHEFKQSGKVPEISTQDAATQPTPKKEASPDPSKKLDFSSPPDSSWVNPPKPTWLSTSSSSSSQQSAAPAPPPPTPPQPPDAAQQPGQLAQAKFNLENYMTTREILYKHKRVWTMGKKEIPDNLLPLHHRKHFTNLYVNRIKKIRSLQPNPLNDWGDIAKVKKFGDKEFWKNNLQRNFYVK